MRKFFSAAVLAAFLSILTSGCYTRFGRSEPPTGERLYQREYIYDDPYYRDYYPYPLFFGFPYYDYGFFYSPWWYDPGYYYYDDDYRNSTKFKRSRDHNGVSPSIPSGGIIQPSPPPPDPPSSGEVKIRSGSGDGQQSGNDSNQSTKGNSDGKSARRRR